MCDNQEVFTEDWIVFFSSLRDKGYTNN